MGAATSNERQRSMAAIQNCRSEESRRDETYDLKDSLRKDRQSDKRNSIIELELLTKRMEEEREQFLKEMQTRRLEHQSELAKMKTFFEAEKAMICLAREGDRIQMNSHDAVSSLTQSVSRVSEKFIDIAALEGLVSNGIQAEKTFIRKAKAACEFCVENLNTVRENANAICNHQGNNDLEGAKCYEVVKEIPVLVQEFQISIRSLVDVLEEVLNNSHDVEKTIEFLKEAIKNHNKLSEIVNSLPEIPRKRYAMTAIVDSINSIAGTSSGNVQ